MKSQVNNLRYQAKTATDWQPLMFESKWSGREDSNLRPLGPESWAPQHSNMLLFKKLQPPRDSATLTMFYHFLTSTLRRVLSLLDTNWTHVFCSERGTGRFHFAPKKKPMPIFIKLKIENAERGMFHV
jgi:hypothetical protein